jgi:hypothetical protein
MSRASTIMKALISWVIISLSLPLFAGDNILVKLGPLAGATEKRHAALVLYAETCHDSTPALSHKRNAYYAALRLIAEELRVEYFWHDEFPGDVFAGIESRALALVATHYPLSGGTGCSYVDMLRENYMNAMAEEMIVSMAAAICETVKNSNITVTGKPARLEFSGWKKKWDLAAKVEGATNPPASFFGISGAKGPGAANR